MMKKFLFMPLLAFCMTQVGCALLQLPFEIINMALSLAQSLPKPPPGAF